MRRIDMWWITLWRIAFRRIAPWLPMVPIWDERTDSLSTYLCTYLYV